MTRVIYQKLKSHLYVLLLIYSYIHNVILVIKSLTININIVVLRVDLSDSSLINHSYKQIINMTWLHCTA